MASLFVFLGLAGICGSAILTAKIEEITDIQIGILITAYGISLILLGIGAILNKIDENQKILNEIGKSIGESGLPANNPGWQKPVQNNEYIEWISSQPDDGLWRCGCGRVNIAACQVCTCGAVRQNRP